MVQVFEFLRIAPKGTVATHTMLTTARDAYSSGMHSAALAGAVLLVLTGLFALRALRNEPVLPAAPKKEKANKGETDKKAKKGKKTELVEPSPGYAASVV